MAAPIRILRDTREQFEPSWADGYEVETVQLPFGDFSVAGAAARLAIELKWSLDDYVTCCTWERERFETMLAGLRKYPVRAIVVAASEADVLAERYHSRANPRAVLASSYAWIADYSVSTIWAGDRERATRVIEWFARRVITKARAKK